MKKKGFTLIELLAVIVILAIITVIAVPKILDVIEKSKLEAFKDTAYGISEAAKEFTLEKELNNIQSKNYEFNFENNIQSSKSGELLKFKGDVPDSGNVIITKDNKIKLAIWSNELKKCAYKNYDSKKIYISENIKSSNQCATNIEATKSTWFWINYNIPDEIKYVIDKKLREEVIDLLAENGINKIYIPLYLDHIQDTYEDFIIYANKKNIKIYNLIGDPTSIKNENYNRTINLRMDEMNAFNEKMKKNGINAKIEGMHYDVEFYANGNTDFGLGKWIGGQSEEAKQGARRLAYINFAKEAKKYAKEKGLKVEYDVPQVLSKLTYYDENNNEKNMLEELLKNSDNITVMYYVTMKKYITTDNDLTFTGTYKFSLDDDPSQSQTEVLTSTIGMINKYHNSYSIGSELAFFRQDDTKMNECNTSFKNELKPYIDADLKYTQQYMSGFYKLQIKNLSDYQESNNMVADIGISYHDAWELLYLLGYKDTKVMNDRTSAFEETLNGTNCYK